jgi:hypothetical protein
MAIFGMYGGKKFQDKIREKLLLLLDKMIHGEEDTGTVTMTAMYSWAFCDGIDPFKDQLDLHNRCLLSNVEYQSDKIYGISNGKAKSRKRR